MNSNIIDSRISGSSKRINGSEPPVDESQLAYDCCFTETYALPERLRSKFVESITCAGKPVIFTVGSDGAVYMSIRESESKTGWSEPSEIPFQDKNGDTISPPSKAGKVRAISASSIDDGRAMLAVCTDTGTYIAATNVTVPDPSAWGPLAYNDTITSACGKSIQAVAAGSLPSNSTPLQADTIWLGIQKARTVWMYQFTYFNYNDPQNSASVAEDDDNNSFSSEFANSVYPCDPIYGKGYWRGGPTKQPMSLYDPLDGDSSSWKTGQFRSDWGCGNIVCSRDDYQDAATLVFTLTGLAKDDGNGNDNTQCVLSAIIGLPKFNQRPPFWSMQLIGTRVDGSKNKGCVIKSDGKNDTNINSVLATDLVCLPRSDSGKYALAVAFFADEIKRPDSDPLYNAVNVMYLTNTQAGQMANIGRFHYLVTPNEHSALYPDVLRVAQIVDTSETKYAAVTEGDDTSSQRASKGIVAMCCGGGNHSNNEPFGGYVAINKVVSEDDPRYLSDGNLQKTANGTTMQNIQDAVRNTKNALPSFGPIYPKAHTKTFDISKIYLGAAGQTLVSGTGGDACYFFTATDDPKSFSPVTSWFANDPVHTGLYPEPVCSDAALTETSSSGELDEPTSIPVYSVQFAPDLISKATRREMASRSMQSESAPKMYVRGSVPTECLIDGKSTFLLSHAWEEIPIGGTITLASYDLSCPTLEFYIPGTTATQETPAVILPENGVAKRLAVVTPDDLQNPVDNAGINLNGPILGDNANTKNNATCATLSNELGQSVLDSVNPKARGKAPCVRVDPNTRRVDPLKKHRTRQNRQPFLVTLNRPGPSSTWAENTQVDSNLTPMTTDACLKSMVAKAEGCRSLNARDFGLNHRDRTQHQEPNETVAFAERWLAENQSYLVDQSGASEGDLNKLRSILLAPGKTLFSEAHELVRTEKLFVTHYWMFSDIHSLGVTLEDADGYEYFYFLADWTASQAMSIVSDLYTSFKVAYEKLREWLSWLFDWDAITGVAECIQGLFAGNEKLMAATLEAAGAKACAMLNDMRGSIDEAFTHFEDSEIGSSSLNDALNFINGKSTTKLDTLPVGDAAISGGHNPFISPSNFGRGELNGSNYTGEVSDLDPDAIGIWAKSKDESILEKVRSLSESYDPADLLNLKFSEALEPIPELLNGLLNKAEEAIEGIEEEVQVSLTRYNEFGNSGLFIPLISNILDKFCGVDTTKTTPSILMSYMIAVPVSATGRICIGDDVFSKDNLEVLRQELDDDIDALVSWIQSDRASFESPPKLALYASSESEVSYTPLKALMAGLGTASQLISVLLAASDMQLDKLAINPADHAYPMQRYLRKMNRSPELGTLLGWMRMSLEGITFFSKCPAWRNLYANDTMQWGLWVSQLLIRMGNVPCVMSQGKHCAGVQCQPVYYDITIGSVSRVLELVQAILYCKKEHEAGSGNASFTYNLFNAADSLVCLVLGFGSVLNTISRSDPDQRVTYNDQHFHTNFAPWKPINWRPAHALSAEPYRFMAYNYLSLFTGGVSAAMHFGIFISGLFLLEQSSEDVQEETDALTLSKSVE